MVRYLAIFNHQSFGGRVSSKKVAYKLAALTSLQRKPSNDAVENPIKTYKCILSVICLPNCVCFFLLSLQLQIHCQAYERDYQNGGINVEMLCNNANRILLDDIGCSSTTSGHRRCTESNCSRGKWIQVDFGDFFPFWVQFSFENPVMLQSLDFYCANSRFIGQSSLARTRTLARVQHFGDVYNL